MHPNNNVLLCGYLRETQQYHKKLEIPNLVKAIVGDYCKQYTIRRFGSDENEFLTQNISSEFENVIVNQAYTENISKVFKANSTHYKTGHSNAQWIASVIKNQTSLDQLDTNILQSRIEGDITCVECGLNHVIFLTSTGKCYALGSNENGQCGFDEKIIELAQPTLVPFESKIISVACGHFHSLFVNEQNKLLVCGSNTCCELGMQSVSEPQWSDVESDEADSESEWIAYVQSTSIFKPKTNTYFTDRCIPIKAALCGSHHSLCITTTGSVYTFGHNAFSNLGTSESTPWGTGEDIPCKLNLNHKIVDGSCGANHNVLLTNENKIIVFGCNQDNQCSEMNNDEQIQSPYILSKERELSDRYCFVDKVICINDETLLLIDKYKAII